MMPAECGRILFEKAQILKKDIDKAFQKSRENCTTIDKNDYEHFIAEFLKSNFTAASLIVKNEESHSKHITTKSAAQKWENFISKIKNKFSSFFLPKNESSHEAKIKRCLWADIDGSRSYSNSEITIQKQIINMTISDIDVLEKYLSQFMQCLESGKMEDVKQGSKMTTSGKN